MAAGDIIGKEEYERWIHPPHALALLSEVADVPALVSTIAHHLEDGLIRSAAETIKVKESSHQWEYVEIDPRFWIGWACLADNVFWQTGNRETFRDTEPTKRFGLAPVRLYRVRFDPAGIDRFKPPPLPKPKVEASAMAAAIGSAKSGRRAPPEGDLPRPDLRDASAATLLARGVESQSAAPAARNPVGRPSKPFWDDMWVEIVRRVYEDGYQPASIAEIAGDMMQWAADHGHDMSDSTAKRAARKLFEVFKGGA